MKKAPSPRQERKFEKRGRSKPPPLGKPHARWDEEENSAMSIRLVSRGRRQENAFKKGRERNFGTSNNGGRPEGPLGVKKRGE